MELLLIFAWLIMLQSICTAWPDGGSLSVTPPMMSDVFMFNAASISPLWLPSVFRYLMIFSSSPHHRRACLNFYSRLPRVASLLCENGWRLHPPSSLFQMTHADRRGPQWLKGHYITLSCHWHSYKLIFIQAGWTLSKAIRRPLAHNTLYVLLFLFTGA